jgi:nitrate/nitrite transporter NarK
MADDEEASGFTASNLVGCAVGTVTFLLIGMMAFVGIGIGCPPDFPCQDRLPRSFLVALALALLAGILAGWGTAKLYRWIARRSDS